MFFMNMEIVREINFLSSGFRANYGMGNINSPFQQPDCLSAFRKAR